MDAPLSLYIPDTQSWTTRIKNQQPKVSVPQKESLQLLICVLPDKPVICEGLRP